MRQEKGISADRQVPYPTIWDVGGAANAPSASRDKAVSDMAQVVARQQGQPPHPTPL